MKRYRSTSKDAPSDQRSTRKRNRRYFKRSVPRSLRTNNLIVKRTSFSSTWAFGTASTNDFWRYYTFTAADINNFSEMSALFDEYKINAIKVTFRPRYDTAQTGSLPQAYAHVVIDPESTVAPTGVYSAANLNTFLENSGVKTYTLNRPFSVYFKPKVSDQLFGGGTASSLLNPPFVKSNETAVQHRGFHVYLQQNSFATANTEIRLDTFYTFYLTLRNMK